MNQQGETTATALFRAHATARLRGEAVEAAGLAAQIGEARQMTHLLFLICLLAGVVHQEYGDRPDPDDLAALTKRLHERHFPTDPTFNALRAEAMVRAVCGESALLNEVPADEQAEYAWAVMHELIGTDITDEELKRRFEQIEEVRGNLMAEFAIAAALDRTNPHDAGPAELDQTKPHDAGPATLDRTKPHEAGPAKPDRAMPGQAASRRPVLGVMVGEVGQAAQDPIERNRVAFDRSTSNRAASDRSTPDQAIAGRTAADAAEAAAARGIALLASPVSATPAADRRSADDA
ncbi:hypothetical protein [Glycomyces sp. NRRL B-16210]|uniref:hypothetical protein n=1 Tax=Glycomyces sp. NRRL B-16210 TaxID=1463821 RepID=UPI0004C0A88D|nr:hypothetical protein [Glycomyces sp. NRRL B-16210]